MTQDLKIFCMSLLGYARTSSLMRRVAIPNHLKPAYEEFVAERENHRISSFLMLGFVVFSTFSMISYWVIPDVWKVDVVGRFAICLSFFPIFKKVLDCESHRVRELAGGIGALIASLWLCSVSASSMALTAPLSMSSNILVVIYIVVMMKLSTRLALLFSVTALVIQSVATEMSSFGTGPMHLVMMAIGLSILGSTLFSNRQLENEQRRTFLLSEQDRLNLDRLRERNVDLDKLSETDPLTGLGNRRMMDRFLMDADNAVGPHAGSYFFLIVDVDCFKSYNDLYGHLAGDRTLQSISSSIRSACSISDLVCRFGGEEFVVIKRVNSADEDGSITKLAEKIRRSVEALRIGHLYSNHNRVITVSVGFAKAVSIQDARRAIECADKALYTAKSLGRNCVVNGSSANTTSHSAAATKGAKGAKGAV